MAASDLDKAHDPPISFIGRLHMSIIGIGYLFPISAVWAAFDYWKVLFPNQNVEFAVTCTYQFLAVWTVFVLSFVPQVHFSKGILGGFSGQFLALLVITCFPIFGLPTSVEYNLLLASVAFCAVATGFLDSALLSLCSQYSPRMQGALQIGIGLSTSVSVLYRDVTKFFYPNEVVTSAMVYFSAALATIWICLATFFSLKRMPISQGIFHRVSVDSTSLMDSASEEEGTMRSLMGRVWKNEASIFVNFILTTIAYPGLITAVNPRSSFFQLPNHWYQTILLSFFAAADTSSRFLLGYRGGLSWKNIHYAVIIRCLLFPTIVACVLGYVPDVLIFTLVGIYGASNGYVCSLSLVVVNEVPGLTQKERLTVGRWSAFSVNAGLCLGSFFGAAVGLYLRVA